MTPPPPRQFIIIPTGTGFSFSCRRGCWKRSPRHKHPPSGTADGINGASRRCWGCKAMERVILRIFSAVADNVGEKSGGVARAGWRRGRGVNPSGLPQRFRGRRTKAQGWGCFRGYATPKPACLPAQKRTCGGNGGETAGLLWRQGLRWCLEHCKGDGDWAEGF